VVALCSTTGRYLSAFQAFFSKNEGLKRRSLFLIQSSGYQSLALSRQAKVSMRDPVQNGCKKPLLGSKKQ